MRWQSRHRAERTQRRPLARSRVVFLCAFVGSLFAAGSAARADAVWGEVFPLRDPDGTVTQVRVWGDEFYRVIESLDGFTLTCDPVSRAACYARLSADGNDLVSTGVRVSSPLRTRLGLQRHIRIQPAAARTKALAARAEAAMDLSGGDPTIHAATAAAQPAASGNVQALCLIVDFSDEPGTIPPATVDAYCNQIGFTGYGNNGSVRDYYYAVSNGHLTYTNYVPAAYYRAQHPKSYYNDPDITYGLRARELVIEALTALDNQPGGFDFSQYDSNGDGYVDGINCFYAGYRNAAWSEGLWPHSWTVSFSADGVSTYKYQITDMRDSLTLSTFCHENGHMLCFWPDLYDYGYESMGVGRFCLMCYSTSNTNPQHPCAPLKLDVDWTNTTLLTTPQTGLIAPAAGNVCYRYNHPTLSNEYFIVESRYRSGRDAGLPDEGLAIWHVDLNGSNNNEQMTPLQHYRVTLVQADGRWDLEYDRNDGDSTDLWAAPSYTECDDSTTPNTHWWSGSPSGLRIADISAAGTTMTFTFGDWADCNENSVPDTEDIATGTSEDCNTNGVPDECEADSDGDGVIDGCDACAETVPGTLVGANGCALGDVNHDGDVDLNDFGVLQVCFNGPNRPLPATWCDVVDLDGDTDIDLSDFSLFSRCFNGPNRIPACRE
ncbi:MAG: M6 family metalloprotease domain-containing protein [Phycisphaerae bacterium]|nr:M6 family metalloprotease domain-containing protein [Phycisphaerae bacterium]